MVKVKLTVSILPELINWIDEEVKKGHFAGRSHAVAYSLMKVKQLMKAGEIKF